MLQEQNNRLMAFEQSHDKKFDSDRIYITSLELKAAFVDFVVTWLTNAKLFKGNSAAVNMC